MKREKVLIVIIGILLFVVVLFCIKTFPLFDPKIDTFSIEDISEERLEEIGKEFKERIEKNQIEVPNMPQSDVLVMQCAQGKTFSMSFMEVENSPGPGVIPVPLHITLATVKVEENEYFLRLHTKELQEKYTFSNLQIQDQQQPVILTVQDNVAELFMGNDASYTQCTNSQIEEERLLLN